jgi:hypothetical protein
MRFPKLIVTTAFLFTFLWAQSPDAPSGLGPAGLLGVRALWAGTLNFNTRGAYLYYMEHRLKSDLSALYEIAEEFVKETRLNSRSADYKQVSHSANKIRKLASRIKSGLTLGNLPMEEKAVRDIAPQTASPDLLRSQIDELNSLLHKIRRSPVGRTKHVIDAKLQHEFYAELDTLESLAGQVKANADELMLKSE